MADCGTILEIEICFFSSSRGLVIFTRSLYFLLDEIKNNKEVRTMWIKELKLMTLVYEMYSSGKTKDYILSKTNISSDDYERYITIGNKFKYKRR